jgi:hypothetical protein
MSGTGDWHPGPLLGQAELLGVRVGIWNHLQYPDKVPGAGEHDAGAMKQHQTELGGRAEVS